jgi:8-oxo-dGTP diphosphatase
MQQQVRVGVACIIKKQQDDIDTNCVLIGKRRSSHGASKIQLPGGHLEFGEELEQCVRREVMEETGLNVHNIKMFTLTNDIMKEDNKHYVTIFMTCELVCNSDEAQNLESHKNEFWKWIEWNELIHYGDQMFLPLYNVVVNKKLNPFI